jgi:hypothetical protein
MRGASVRCWARLGKPVLPALARGPSATCDVAVDRFRGDYTTAGALFPVKNWKSTIEC